MVNETHPSCVFHPPPFILPGAASPACRAHAAQRWAPSHGEELVYNSVASSKPRQH